MSGVVKACDRHGDAWLPYIAPSQPSPFEGAAISQQKSPLPDLSLIKKTGSGFLLELLAVAALLLVLAVASPSLDRTGMAFLLGLNAIFMGVVQVTLQMAAEPALLGSAAASVRLSVPWEPRPGPA